MGQRALMAAVAVGFVMWSAQGCVEERGGDGSASPPTDAPTSGKTPKPSDDADRGSPVPPSPGGTGSDGGGSGSGGGVEGDPDADIPDPGGAPETPEDLVAAVEKAVLARKTARFEATASLNGLRRAEADGGYVFRSEERVDFRVDLDMRSRSGGDYSARAVAEGEDFYLKPPSTDGMPDGKSWVGRSRADFEDPPEPRALYSEAIRSISGIRDWSMIAGAGDLVPAGPRTVDGVRGSGYRATFSVLEGMDNVSGKGGAWRVLQDLHAQGVREISFTVWVDGDYLPVAVVVLMDTDSGPGHVDLRFSDWGGTVDLPVPDKGSVWRRS